MSHRVRPASVRSLAGAEKSPLCHELAVRVEAYEFIQYLFFGQWRRLRQRAAQRGIEPKLLRCLDQGNAVSLDAQAAGKIRFR